MREVGRLSSRPLWWVVLWGLPLFCAIFMATVFAHGEVEELPIGIVDEEFTATSRAITRALDSSPTMRVAERYDTPQEALEGVKSGRIVGYVLLPQHTERQVIRGENVEIPYYCNYALLGMGADMDAAVRKVMIEMTGKWLVNSIIGYGMGVREAEVMAQPTRLMLYPTRNQSLNYSEYLSWPFYFIMFQIVVMLATVYLIGREIADGSAQEWVAVAGGKVGLAVVGKLLPTALAFCVGAMAGGLIINNLVVAVEVWRTWGYAALLVVSSMALAVALLAIYPRLSIIMSVVSMVGSLGATLAGVTFPTESMWPIFSKLAQALPVRHFTLLYENLAYGDGKLDGLWGSVVAMLVPILAAAALMPRLGKCIKSGRYEEVD